MSKFSIRDIVLVTAIVGLMLGWWLDHRRQTTIADDQFRRLTFVDNNLFQLVADINAKGMGVTPDERGFWAIRGRNGIPGPHRSQIDGSIPEPVLPPNLVRVGPPPEPRLTIPDLRTEPGYTTALRDSPN
jgi:hypothetical protein